MKIPKHLLDSVSLHGAAVVHHVNHNMAGKDKVRTLRRRADGGLEFMNGSPVREGELIPGVRYQIVGPSGAKK